MEIEKRKYDMGGVCVKEIKRERRKSDNIPQRDGRSYSLLTHKQTHTRTY